MLHRTLIASVHNRYSVAIESKVNFRQSNIKKKQKSSGLIYVMYT